MTTRRRQVGVDIIGNADKLERELRRAEADLDRTRKRLEEHGIAGERSTGQNDRLALSMRSVGSAGLAMAAGVGAGVAVLAAGYMAAKNLSGAASDLQEEQDKVRVVFAESSAAVLAFGRDAAYAYGQSERAALSGAGAVGNMLLTTGLAREEAARMSIQMVALSSDMASFSNQDPEEMLTKLRSGLAGEAEPLRQFGVLLSEARVEAKALELGIISKGQTLSEQGKVLARYAIILEDTNVQQGNFADTSKNLANQNRIAEASFENLRAKMGNELLPVMTDLRRELNEFLEANDEDIVRNFASAIAVLGTAASGALAALEQYADFIDYLRDKIGKEPLFHLSTTPGAMGFSERGIRDMSDNELQQEMARTLDVIAINDRMRASGPGPAAVDSPTIRRLDEANAAYDQLIAEQKRRNEEKARSRSTRPSVDYTPLDFTGMEGLSSGSAKSTASGSKAAGPTAFSAEDLAFIERAVGGLSRAGWLPSSLQEFEAMQATFDARRRDLNRTLSELGLEMADLDARGQEQTETYTTLKGRVDAAQDALKRIDLVEDLRLEPFRDAMKEAREAVDALAKAEKDRHDALISRVEGRLPGIPDEVQAFLDFGELVNRFTGRDDGSAELDLLLPLLQAAGTTPTVTADGIAAGEVLRLAGGGITAEGLAEALRGLAASSGGATVRVELSDDLQLAGT
jgi:hypothetical protein